MCLFLDFKYEPETQFLTPVRERFGTDRDDATWQITKYVEHVESKKERRREGQARRL